MTLPSPNLDDRDFEQLVADAKLRIAQTCPGWTDLSPGDPGMVLLEVFAHLSETMIYRLNRLPEKTYIELLRLLGVTLRPPSAAGVSLQFTRSHPDQAEQAIKIKRGIRVTVERAEAGSEPPVFVTTRSVSLEPGMTEVVAPALHCELVDELAGTGTGLPGHSVTARRPPIIADTGDGLDLVVGVEAEPGELDERAPAVKVDGSSYRIWREVEGFSNLGSDRHVYVADRITGVITFAPAARMTAGDKLDERPSALAEIPGAERKIRLWYRRGGGIGGNLAAALLTVLKDPLPGLTVSNPEPAIGGRTAETVANALIRGPQEFHSLKRAVTAQDFELVAKRASGAIARARAFTRAAFWKHATPGTVEILVVPFVPEQERGGGQLSARTIRQRQTEGARRSVLQAIDERRPLGITCLVSWARYKPVRIRARVVVYREEDPAAVAQRVVERLHQVVNPLPVGSSAGWRFGQALRASNVYDIVLSEPGVSYVDQVRLLVDEVPAGEITCLAADVFQSRVWYAGCGELLFRSLNDGEGWEPAGRFTGEAVTTACASPDRAGVVAVATTLNNQEQGSRIYLSLDCGERWWAAAKPKFLVRDLAWMKRGNLPVLLMATDVGLYELPLARDASLVQIVVDPQDHDLGFYSVAVAKGLRGELSVAVAAEKTRGVFLSSEGGMPESFQEIGLAGEDVRVLAVQVDGPRSFLWAGVAASGGKDTGKGCFCREIRRTADAPEEWRPYHQGWHGGSCRSLAFVGSKVMAASYHRGVLWLDPVTPEPQWQTPEIGCGLPLRDPGRFHPVAAVAASSDTWEVEQPRLMAGGVTGISRSPDHGITYQYLSSNEFHEKITLPETWLFCSGEHEVTVVSEDEAEAD